MRIARIAAATAAASFLLVATSAALAQSADWCKSKFSADDEIGAANLLSAAGVLEAAKLVKTGKTYGLGVETNSRSPAYPPRAFSITIVQPGQSGGTTMGPTRTTYNDDIISGWVGIGSQLDGLGHIGVDNVYYNCNKAADFAQASGLKKLGIEKLPPFVTRGVLLDMTAANNGQPLAAGVALNKKEIDDAMKRQNVEIRKGDVVLLHTGYQAMADKDPKAFLAGEPGLGKEGAEYLVSKGVVAVGADQWAVEVIPFEPGVGVFEVHQVLLPRNGVFILENMNTGPLVADKAWEFMFVLGPSRITGAVQSIVNPVAIR
jgi:kynurenine formamidase